VRKAARQEPAAPQLRPARPLERQAIGDHVSEHIRRLIFHGVLRAGDRIPIDAIAGELGVSRLPVREAVLGMARDGLVRVRPHHGAYVDEFDEQVLRDHFEIVGMMQGLAAVRVAEQGDPAVLDRLAELAADAKRSSSAQEIYDIVMDFNRTINLAGGSSRQRSVLRVLGRLFPTGFFASLPGAAESARTGMARLVRALRSGDADRIRAACAQDTAERCDIVVDHLRSTGVFEPAQKPPRASKRNGATTSET
jgi:DNA-binding GntR family transcriptional regulator